MTGRGKRLRRGKASKEFAAIERGWRRAHAKAQGQLCYYCEAPFARPGNPPTLDHKQPIHKGGAHDFDNTCAACLSCNARKGVMTEKQFKDLLKAERRNADQQIPGHQPPADPGDQVGPPV